MSEPSQLLQDSGPHLREAASPDETEEATWRRAALQAAMTSFEVLFCIVGLALWGLPFYYDFMVQQFGWTRAQVTSGNALSKLIIGPAFGLQPDGSLIASAHVASCWRAW